MIHEECLNALLDGKEVNLFNLATIRQLEIKGHSRNSLNGMIEVEDRTILKAKVFNTLKREWEYTND